MLGLGVDSGFKPPKPMVDLTLMLIASWMIPVYDEEDATNLSSAFEDSQTRGAGAGGIEAGAGAAGIARGSSARGDLYDVGHAFIN
ncbi:hypothetical protein GB937_004090 [Aspergillus fischeri]|nr:hypothetical protein GB937_004090 [Aspergillus fischeri]